MAKKKTSKKAAEKPAVRAGGKTKKAAKKADRKTSEKKVAKKAAIPPVEAAPIETIPDESQPLRGEPKGREGKAGYATAETMAKAQRDISVSEFFAKNRHLLGFDNPRKALLTTVKEAVDNSLDACEEAGILPVVEVGIKQLGETHFNVVVQDNGPGIVRNQIPSIFGRLLYGSKFHRLRMSRGQQGIGISAAGMYGLLTTGRPVKITSRIGKRSKAHYYELQIDTQKNRPDIIRDDVLDDWEVEHGTRVEIELEAKYQRGRQSIDDYLLQTAIANPHVTFIYHAPDGREEKYEASVKELPAIAKAIRPHPHGVELGVLLKMIQQSKARTAQQFLTGEFSRISPRVANEILEKAGISPRQRPSSMNGDAAKAIYNAIQTTKIMAPATDCVVPIGEEQLLKGLRQVVNAAFYVSTTRSPSVYRGNPFVIEAAIAFGRPEEANNDKPAAQTQDESDNGESEENSEKGPDDENQLARVMRFANRVPLLYQQGACAITKSVIGTNWRQYGLTQSRGALPGGPLTIVIHMGSVWVPFTSESKEAIASYPEIMKEIRLALQTCGRKLATHIRKEVRFQHEMKKRSYIEKYIPIIGEALKDILDLDDKQVTRVCRNLTEVLHKSRKL